MGEKWIDFVKRIHSEGLKKDKDYSFKQAMVDAGKRKGEWKKGASSASGSENKTKKRTKKGGRKSRKSRKSRKH
jgi:hypothetical protein